MEGCKLRLRRLFQEVAKVEEPSKKGAWWTEVRCNCCFLGTSEPAPIPSCAFGLTGFPNTCWAEVSGEFVSGQEILLQLLRMFPLKDLHHRCHHQNIHHHCHCYQSQTTIRFHPSSAVVSIFIGLQKKTSKKWIKNY